MKKTLFVILLFVALHCKADQHSSLTLEMAKKTFAFFKEYNIKEVVLWCACCDDDPVRQVNISNYYYKKITHNSNYYYFYIEGISHDGEKIEEKIDLAYVHIKLSHKAVCLATALNFDCDPCTESFDWPVSNRMDNNPGIEAVSAATIDSVRAFNVSDTPTKEEIDAIYSGNWKTFLQENIRADVPLRKGAPAGTYIATVQFMINENGKVANIKPITKYGYGMEEELMRVLRMSKTWYPATLNGKKVKAYRKQSIPFYVPKKNSKPVSQVMSF